LRIQPDQTFYLVDEIRCDHLRFGGAKPEDRIRFSEQFPIARLSAFQASRLIVEAELGHMLHH
jgi:hypothetical protein